MWDIVSTGRAASELSIAEGELFFVMQRLGHLPVMKIDDCCFYHAEAVDVAREYLAKKKQEAANVVR